MDWIFIVATITFVGIVVSDRMGKRKVHAVLTLILIIILGVTAFLVFEKADYVSRIITIGGTAIMAIYLWLYVKKVI